MSDSYLAAVIVRSLDACDASRRPGLPPASPNPAGLPPAPPPPALSCVTEADLWCGAHEVESFFQANSLAAGSQSVVVASDGRSFATRMHEGDDETIGIYSLSDGSIRGLKGHTDVVCALSADGERLASGSADGWVRLWFLGSGECFAKAGVGSEVLGVSLAGSYLSTGDAAQTSKLWQLGTGDPSRVWMGYKDGTDGNPIVVTISGHVGEVAHEGSVYCTLTNASGLVCSVGRNHTDLKVWSHEGVLHEARTPAAALCAMAAEGDCVFIGLRNGHVVGYSLSTGTLLYDFASNPTGKEVTCLAVKGDVIAVGSEYLPFALRFWSLAGEKPKLRLSRDASCAISCLTFAPNSSIMVTADTEGEVTVWSPSST